MKFKLIGLVLALVLVFVPMGSVGASTTADITINATPAYISISVDNITYAFGVVETSGVYNTSTSYFTITNGSNVATHQYISVTSDTWAGGTTWTHSETATAGADTVGLEANRGGSWGTGDIIVKNADANYIYESCPASTGYSFGLQMSAPTSFSDGTVKSNTVRVTAVSNPHPFPGHGISSADLSVESSGFKYFGG